jgi:hypothetical protein
MSEAFTCLLAMVNTKIAHNLHTIRLANTQYLTANLVTDRTGHDYRSRDKDSEASFIELKGIQMLSVTE